MTVRFEELLEKDFKKYRKIMEYEERIRKGEKL